MKEKQVTHDERELRFKLKQLRQQCGSQGKTIHHLRAELAEIRDLNSKIDRGRLRTLERLSIEQNETIARLTEKLEDQE